MSRRQQRIENTRDRLSNVQNAQELADKLTNRKERRQMRRFLRKEGPDALKNMPGLRDATKGLLGDTDLLSGLNRRQQNHLNHLGAIFLNQKSEDTTSTTSTRQLTTPPAARSVPQYASYSSSERVNRTNVSPTASEAQPTFTSDSEGAAKVADELAEENQLDQLADGDEADLASKVAELQATIDEQAAVIAERTEKDLDKSEEGSPQGSTEGMHHNPVAEVWGRGSKFDEADHIMKKLTSDVGKKIQEAWQNENAKDVQQEIYNILPEDDKAEFANKNQDVNGERDGIIGESTFNALQSLVGKEVELSVLQETDTSLEINAEGWVQDDAVPQTLQASVRRLANAHQGWKVVLRVNQGTLRVYMKNNAGNTLPVRRIGAMDVGENNANLKSEIITQHIINEVNKHQLSTLQLNTRIGRHTIGFDDLKPLLIEAGLSQQNISLVRNNLSNGTGRSSACSLSNDTHIDMEKKEFVYGLRITRWGSNMKRSRRVSLKKVTTDGILDKNKIMKDIADRYVERLQGSRTTETSENAVGTI